MGNSILAHEPTYSSKVVQDKPKRLALVLLASLFVSWAFSINLMWGFQKGFGYRSGDNSPLEFVIHGIAALFGGFYAGFFNRKKGLVVGALVAVSSVVIWAFLVLGLLKLAAGQSLTLTLEQLDPETIRPLKVFAMAFIPMTIACGAMGGLLGQHFAYSDYAEDPLVGFFLRFDWKIILTGLFIAECVGRVITYGETIWLHLRWLLVGNVFILIHPSLWFAWDAQGWASFLMSLSIFGIALLIYLPKTIFNIFQARHRHVTLNVLIALLAWAGVITGSHILFQLSISPIHQVVRELTESGKPVWSILLSREMRPKAYENLKTFYEKKGDVKKAEEYAQKASGAYYELARYYYNGEVSLAEARASMEKAASLTPTDYELRLALGRLLAEQEDFEKASAVFLEVAKQSESPYDLMEAADYFQGAGDREHLRVVTDRLRQLTESSSEEEKAVWSEVLTSYEMIEQ